MMIQNEMRPAFSMITAILVILLMASVGVLVINLSGKMVHETTDRYRHEQAILYAKSYTEFAIMAATARKCTKKISANVDGDEDQVREGHGYRVEAYIHYIGNNAGCTFATQMIGGAVNHADSIGGVILIDTFVRYRDPDDPGSTKDIPWSSNKGFTYHHRTLQRL